jgi:hypothetical protein
MALIIVELLLELLGMAFAGTQQEKTQPNMHAKPIDHPDYPPLEPADRVAAIYALIDQRKNEQTFSG